MMKDAEEDLEFGFQLRTRPPAGPRLSAGPLVDPEGSAGGSVEIWTDNRPSVLDLLEGLDMSKIKFGL
ncbi:hypothetical protein P154DRAFT_518429 [Amniculicola lignicola CBS 123094]|uniref:Uncharacterized protein n=1 Tax=Amniculicola lignicola CBS 123094 TaxID=1392246 RepID=A0A6A5X2K9_9PLEO|nr:hypothetical protein P154DRAFT_518429 [Amniculicola lignicola CBS 123094]